MSTSISIVGVLLISLCGCGESGTAIDLEAHRQEIEQWKEKRLARLTSDDGWLTLAGLFWLKEGENTFGRDSTNDIIFPAGKAPRRAGALWLENGIVRMQARPRVEMKHKDSLVTSIIMQSDEEGSVSPTILNIGAVSFYIIKRGDQLGVRVKDKENPARLNFKGLDFFPIDHTWRIEAKFKPYTPPKVLDIPSQVGTIEKYESPGLLIFEIDGKTYTIDAVIEKGSENQLFIMFTDETNGEETYQVGRQLYAALPDTNNNVIIDFNKAYNWPCVFTEFATCPIPPRQNHLPIRVEAGEKMYRGH
ncbi:MAG: DUF1684 domain-containing protein [Ignavibacteriae bacterium]|nr:DUF1684 domain-containing protein [Ignavibacteriota bacterium]